MTARQELILKFGFEASHSLSDYETPHSHLWKLEFSIAGSPIEGRIIDLVLLRARIQKQIDLLSMSYLNENPVVNDQVRLFPTCESLTVFFMETLQRILEVDYLPKNNTLRLSSVMVALCEMNGLEIGAAKLSGQT